MYIVINCGPWIAHVRRLSHQLFFMQSHSPLSLPAFQLLQSHTTNLAQLRILFPTVSVGAYTTYFWFLRKRDNHSLIPMPELLSGSKLKVVQFTTKSSKLIDPEISIRVV